MSEKVLEAFREKETYNIFELLLKLKTDKDSLKEALNILVNQGKLRVGEIRFPRSGDLPVCERISSRSSICGFSGELYIMNDE